MVLSMQNLPPWSFSEKMLHTLLKWYVKCPEDGLQTGNKILVKLVEHMVSDRIYFFPVSLGYEI